jgi:thiol-disulfide isomerase/thioredoxin
MRQGYPAIRPTRSRSASVVIRRLLPGWVRIGFAMTLMLHTAGCSSDRDSNRLSAPGWNAVLDLGPVSMPFTLYWDGADSAWLPDGDQPMVLRVLRAADGAIRLEWPVFGSALVFSRQGDALSGWFEDPGRGEQFRLPFRASAGSPPPGEDPSAFLGRDWYLVFRDAQGSNPAAARFYPAEGSRVEGTVLSPTGDHRYLSGRVMNDTLELTGFDGAHLFYYRASVQADGSLAGSFWSGPHYRAEWTATRDAGAYAVDGDSLTWLAGQSRGLDFCFPDLQGNLRCDSDPAWEGKVLVVQIMGSWCPNCLDETRFLLERHARYAQQGLAVVSLAFERGTDASAWKTAAARMAADLQLPWPVLLAGPASKAEASRLLPDLSGVLAFPTTLVIDRSGAVRRIHTGFNGPATGEEYAIFAASFDRLLEELIGEQDL